MKNIWPQVKHSQELHKYLPVDDMNRGKYPDREFFWGILFTVIPDWANKYHQMVIKQRHGSGKDPAEPKTIEVSAKWMQKLQEFDFKSSRK